MDREGGREGGGRWGGGGHDLREYGRHDQNRVTQTFHNRKTIIILKDSREVETSGKQLRGDPAIFAPPLRLCFTNSKPCTSN